MDLLTIVVPIYNIEEYLDRCLDSIYNQTYKDFKVLCINDGSTDKSRDIILKYVDLDNRFQLIDKENGGLSDARNYGIKQVKTKYVALVDGDDYVDNNYVETIIKELNKQDLDILVYGYKQYTLNNTDNKELNPPRISDGVYSLDNDKKILAYCSNSAWTKVYKTELFINNNIYYPLGYRHQDLGTTPKLLYKAKKVGFINDCLYNYLLDRPNNITTQIDSKIYHIIDMIKEIIDYYKKENIFDEYKNELYYLSFRNCIQSLRKSMNLKDKKFVYNFIDDVFNFLEDNFKGTKDIYHIKEAKNDYIYMSRRLCKLYYSFKH